MVSSTDFLVDHAYRNVWCSPEQDRQHRVGPARISPKAGAIGNIKIGMRSWNLPTPSEWYHVFMIGDLPPILVGMDTIKDKWVSAMAHCNEASLLIDLYTNSGLHLPLHRSYFLYTHNGALVIAIKHTPKIVNLGAVQPFIRWRSNAWFDGAGNVPINGGITVAGTIATTEAQFYTFQAKWRAAKLKQGYAWAFVNGQRVKDINLTTSALGDVLEFTQDMSVKEVLEVNVKDLLAFDSTLDGIGKYLIPRPGLGTTIDYRDDLDIYVLNYSLAQKYTGLYYHANQDNAVRMVTHRDISIVGAYLRGYVDGADWIWNNDLRVEVIIRNAGWIRELVDENHRIKELFKLPEDQRLRAMIGEESLDVWSAAELENSYYPKIMEAEYTEVTRSMVENAYGYNAVSRLIGDLPLKVDVVNKWVKLPHSVTGLSTVYEYDNAGLLLGWYRHDFTWEYPVNNPTARYVEAYIGKGGVGLSTVYGEAITALEKGVDYRFYLCDLSNGIPRNNWKDVTGDLTKYEIENGQITWLVDTTRFLTAVKNSKDFLSHTIELDYRDDLLAFTVNVTEVRSGRVPVTGIMEIPPGEFDLFMNKFCLVKDIDYYVNWPEVCIVNKAFLVEGSVQSVTMRGRGFCDVNLQISYPKDYGFVKYRQLSHNSRFNVRDDKVCRISIGGQLFTRDEVGFTEDGTTVTVDVKNGTPYQITHPIIPMAGVTDTDTYTYKALSEVIDQKVEDYLTIGLPEPVEPLPDAIPAWYAVFSPFTTKLIFDMLNGLLLMDEFKGEYSLADVEAKLVGYKWILKYDPALKDVNKEYIIIHPHPETDVIELNIYQYRFLTRAIEVFLNKNVDMGHHLVIVEEGFEHEMEDHPHPHRSWNEVGA